MVLFVEWHTVDFNPRMRLHFVILFSRTEDDSRVNAFPAKDPAQH
jgi:hypothetical protein